MKAGRTAREGVRRDRGGREVRAGAREQGQGRRAAAAAAFALLIAVDAGADLVGSEAIRAATADRSDAVLLTANPALRRLARTHPELVQEAIARLRAGVPSRARTLVEDEPNPATPDDHALLAENPDLADLYRESPEAALDLLRLIREAAKEK